jgi:hypothetical protein
MSTAVVWSEEPAAHRRHSRRARWSPASTCPILPVQAAYSTELIRVRCDQRCTSPASLAGVGWANPQDLWPPLNPRGLGRFGDIVETWISAIVSLAWRATCGLEAGTRAASGEPEARRSERKPCRKANERPEGE